MKVAFAILAAGVALGWPSAGRSELADGMEAVVHDSIITSYEVRVAADPLIQELDRRYRDQPQVLNQKLADLRTETLEGLLDNQLILHEFETAGYNLPESVIDDYVQDKIRRDFGGDRIKLIQTLRAEGTTYEAWRKKQRDEFIIGQMSLKNVSSATLISPHKIEVYYLQHTNDFKVADQAKFQMIVLTNGPARSGAETRQLADEVLAKIKDGSQFSEMAKLYSEGPNARDGGDWGWYEPSKLRKELADAATSLKAGEVSSVIDTPEACYIMRVEEKRPAHIQPLNDVRDEIEKTLLAQEHDRLQKQWIERLKNKTFIRYF